MDSTWRRLTATDRSSLDLESDATPMGIAALAMLEARPLLDAAGRFDLARARARLEARLGRVPELRRRLWQPGLFRGGPVWVDDAEFRIDRHVVEFSVPAPGTERELLETAAGLLEPPLDRSHPLWRIWFLTGLRGGRVGMLLELHHALADGLATVALVSSMFDFEPDVPEEPAPSWSAAPKPRARELFSDAWRSRLAAFAAVLRHPLRWLGGVGGLVAEVVAVARQPAAPATSFNRPVRAGRTYRVLSLGLDGVKAAAHANGGKVNDALLAIVGGGLRDLLVERGDSVEGVLEVSVPVGRRENADPRELGNRAGAIQVPMSLADPDPGHRLQGLAAASAAAKRRQQPALATGVVAWLARVGLAQVFINRQRLVNVFVTNVPGPPVPFYVLGARVLEVYPLTAIAGNTPVCFAALSYCGRLNLVVVVDPSAAAEVDVIASGMARAWAQLVSCAEAGEESRQPVGAGTS